MSSAVVVGLGQLGSVFAHGLLRSGVTVVPANRGDALAPLAERLPEPEAVLVTVGEGDLDGVLAEMPRAWSDRVALVQNELLPCDWKKHDLDATAAVVWFEKKKTIATNVILPTPIGGPRAEVLARALTSIDLPVEIVERDALARALVAKNVYILTMNLAGMMAPAGTRVGALYEDHRGAVDAVLGDVLTLQAARLGDAVDADAQRAHLERAIAADPEHGAKGRSAPARLARAVAQGRALGVTIPELERLAAQSSA